MKKFIGMLAVLLFFGTLQAQTNGDASIAGNVKDNTNAPVEFATVAVYNQADSTLLNGGVTDMQGNFKVSELPYGNMYIVIQFVGYKNFTQGYLVLSADNKNIELKDLLLELATTQLGEIDIVSQVDNISIKADKTVLNVDKNISAAGGTAVDALKISPSVTVNQDGNVLLRGSDRFKVLVNGKPTALKPNDVLKQMPAGKIEKIELITNPSAKNDAEGSAGIINIITKKGMGAGTTALINASAGTGNKYNADANLNYTNDKINITLGGKWKNSQQYYNMKQILGTIKDGNNVTNNVDFYRHQTDKDLGTNLTLDYTLNSKNSISYAADAGSTKLYLGATFKYNETIENKNQSHYVFEDLHAKLFADYFTNNLTYTLKPTEKSDWTSSVFYSTIGYYFENNQDRFQTNPNFDTENVTPYYTMRFGNKNNSSEYRAQTDYTNSLQGDVKLETGLQFRQYHRYLNLVAQNYNHTTAQWEANTVFTNEFDFNEKVYSGYGNLSGEKKGFTYNVGLRMEYTDRLIESFTVKQKYLYQKLNYFPTLSVSRNFGQTNSLSLNYLRRIDRPDEYYLNPFPDVSNEYQEAHGNPLLRPGLTDAYELGYKKILDKGMFSSQAYYRVSNKTYNQVISANSEGRIILTFDNISDDKEFGIENMINLQTTKWWNLNASLNLYGQTTDGVLNNQSYSRSAFTFDTRLINSFSIRKTTSLQFMAFYFHDRMSNSIGSIEGFYWADLALQQTFFDDRLSVGIQANDIFRTNRIKMDITRSDYRFYIDQKPEYPVVLFNLSYKFNNYKGSDKGVTSNVKL